MAVELDRQETINKVVSHLPGVIAAVRSKAGEIEVKAKVRLAAHYYRGESSVSVTHGRTDSFVNLDDAAALSIEFGHTHNFTGRYVQGLYIVTGASGLI